MAVLVSYDDGNRLEDVMRAVVQVTPTDTPFMSGMRKTRAYNTVHQWPEDTLSTRRDNAQVEGGSHSFGTLTPPSRISNFTQIFKKTWSVSSTEGWVKGAGVENAELYHKNKALMEIATDIEHALLRGSIASGTGSLARRLGGAINWITTNSTSVASGTKLTESFFNGRFEDAWNNGGTPDEVYVGTKLKRIISGYTAGLTKFIDADDKRLVNSIAVYENDFTKMAKIFVSRDILSGDNTACVLVVESKSFAMAVGEPVHALSKEEVAQTTDAGSGAIRGELTLEVKAQRHNSRALNLSEVFN